MVSGDPLDSNHILGSQSLGCVTSVVMSDIMLLIQL